MKLQAVSLINNVNSMRSAKSTSFNGRNLYADTFERSKKTESSSDEQSFEKFSRWAEKNNFLDNVVDIVEKKGKVLDRQSESTTFEIPNNKDWAIKEYRRSYIIPVHKDKAEISEIHDKMPELNVGQPIAEVFLPFDNPNYSHHYIISKRQTGTPYGISDQYSNYLNESSAKAHLKSLKTASKLPQSSYDKCVKDIKYITEQGYRIANSNPNNISIDEKSKEIHFNNVIDGSDKQGKQYDNVLNSLLDGEFGMRFTEEWTNQNDVKEAKKLSDTITNKFITAMNNQNEYLI